jgi:glycerol-3-phosphate dehydrogenase
VHAIRHEFAVYPADFLARRTTLRYGEDGGRAAYDAVEAIIKERAAVVPPDLAAARERY